MKPNESSKKNMKKVVNGNTEVKVFSESTAIQDLDLNDEKIQKAGSFQSREIRHSEPCAMDGALGAIFFATQNKKIASSTLLALFLCGAKKIDAVPTVKKGLFHGQRY